MARPHCRALNRPAILARTVLAELHQPLPGQRGLAALRAPETVAQDRVVAPGIGLVRPVPRGGRPPQSDRSGTNRTKGGPPLDAVGVRSSPRSRAGVSRTRRPVIRVLVVDDSALVRRVLREELARHPDIAVVGTAENPYVARERILALQPDVVTLDIEMPRMDGLSFLAKLMEHYPLPVVVVSSLTPENSELALQALALGAVEVVPKPGPTYTVPDVHRRLVRAIRAAAQARLPGTLAADSGRGMTAPPPPPSPRTAPAVVAIGASTGGTRAIETLLAALPPWAPGTVIVQHMPEHFTASFAARLNRVSSLEVREARDRDVVLPGLALVAPGNRHLLVERCGLRYCVRVKDGPPVHHQRPSVDVLFDSVARSAGRHAVGVLLTGMGADGAEGLLQMRRQGAYTIAQDEQTCVVFGMPREAIRLGACEAVLPLPEIAPAILQALGRDRRA